MGTIYSNGTGYATVPDSQKIGIYSLSPVQLYKKVGYPNHPDTWNLVATTTAGSEYTSAAFSGATDVKLEATEAFAYFEVGASPSVFEPTADLSMADATATISGLAAAQGGYVKVVGGTSSTAGNAGGAVYLTGGQAGATGAGGAAYVQGAVGGATSGAGGAVYQTGGNGTAGNGNGGNAYMYGGTAHGTGITGHSVIRGLAVFSQAAPTAKTTAATLTIAELKTGLLTGTHAAGATQGYALPTGTLTDAALQLAADDAFDWVLINLSAAALDTITVTAGVDHTIVGNPIVQSSHSSTGGIYGNSAQFRTRKTAANTYVTYRIS